MYDPPRSGIKPLPPALPGRFFITELPGKALLTFKQWHFHSSVLLVIIYIEFVLKTCPENDGWELDLVGRYMGLVVCGLPSKQANLWGSASMLAWISAHFEKVSAVCIFFQGDFVFWIFFSHKNLQWSDINSAEMHIWSKIEQFRIYYQ